MFSFSFLVYLNIKNEKKKMKRKFFVGGNWKMHGNRSFITNLVSSLNQSTYQDVGKKKKKKVFIFIHLNITFIKKKS